MVQRHELEVGELHSWPNHPILLQRSGVGLSKLVLGTLTLHDSHGGEEEEQVACSEEALIGGDAGDDFEVWAVFDHDAPLQEAEPLGGSGSEDAAAVEGHTGGAGEIVTLDAIALNGLLGKRVASHEENGGGDGLGQERARGQLGLVPACHRRLE